MDELLRQATWIARGMWRRRWIGLVAAWVVGIAGAIVVLQIPDRYEANARIFVDTQSVLKPLMSGLAIQPNVEQQVSILARTLISRPNIEKLMRSSDMDLLASSQKEKDRLVDDLIKDIKLTTGLRENIYTVSYQNVQPERAKRVVQNLVSMFVESGLGDKRRDSESARRFIDEQIKVYEQKLEEAENRVKEWRLKNLGLTGGSTQDFFGRMSVLNEELGKVRLELRAAEQSRDSLKQQLQGEDPSISLDVGSSALAASSTPELDARIDAQKRQMDELMRRYTEQHPDVVLTKKLIKQLEEEKQQQIDTQKKAAEEASKSAKPSAATNPVFQQIKIAISEAEANVAALRARVGEISGRIEKLRESAERVPKLETEFSQLNRDYEVLRNNYQGLISRRESAAMSGEVEAAGIAEFRLIEPPRVSPRPVFPNRLALVPLVLAISIGSGLFASFAFSQIFPLVQDARVLHQIANRPVLGSVTFLASDSASRRQRAMNAAFGGGFVGLVLIYGAWLAWVSWINRG